MIAAISFLLDYEKIQGDEDSDDSGSDEDMAPETSQVAINKEAIYKVSFSTLLDPKPSLHFGRFMYISIKINCSSDVVFLIYPSNKST